MDSLIEILTWTWPLLVIVGVSIAWFVTRPRTSCPECGCTKLGKQKIQDETIFHRQWVATRESSPLYTEKYSVQYSCNECRHRWTKAMTETR